MKKKNVIIAIAAALAVVGLSSCAGPQAAKASTATCAGKTSVGTTSTCSDPMGPGCRGNCSGQDCTCRKYPCKCAPKKAVVKPKPEPAPKIVATKPAPPPPVKIVAAPQPPPPPITVSEGWQRYKWEFANPPNGVRVAPGQPLPPGVYPNPAQDGFWMKGEYSERQIPAPQ